MEPDDLDVEAGGAFDQRGGDDGDVGRVGHDQVLLLTETVDDEVVQDTAVLGGDHGVARPTHLQLRQVAGQGVVEGPVGLGAGQSDLAHVGEVEEPGGLADRLVLGGLAAVAERHEPPGEVDERGPGLFVDLVQCGETRRGGGL